MIKQKTSRRVWVSLVTILVVLISVPVVAVSVQTVNTDKIIAQCASIKRSIDTLQKSDALSRVSLGRNYETVLEKLMTNMNVRLAKEHVNAGNLLSITTDFRDNFGYFVKNYVAYDQKISELLSANCEDRPTDFYNALEKARAARVEVHYNYGRLNEIMHEYENELMRVTEEDL